MTYDAKKDERFLTLGMDLSRGVQAALDAVASFYRALDEGRDYGEAYHALRDAFQGRLRDEETARVLSLFAGDTIAVRARMAYERTRRADGYVNHERPGQGAFAIAEALLDSVGEPVTFARLNEISQQGGTFRLRLSGSGAAKILVDLANANPGLVPVKTKDAGKAAYLLRPGDEGPDHGDQWSVYSLKEE